MLLRFGLLDWAGTLNAVDRGSLHREAVSLSVCNQRLHVRAVQNLGVWVRVEGPTELDEAPRLEADSPSPRRGAMPRVEIKVVLDFMPRGGVGDFFLLGAARTKPGPSQERGWDP